MYVVNRKAIWSNVLSIRNAFKRNKLLLILAYSYKTNSMPCVLKEMTVVGAVPEVVSEYEWRVCKNVANYNGFCICNGVAMTYEETAEHVKNGDLVNMNDLAQLRMVRNVLDNDERYDIGLRIRFDDESRFGISVHDLSVALEEIEKLNFNLVSLHCHVTGTRELSKYKRKVSMMVDAIIDNDVNVKYVDLGGSMYGSMPKSLSEQFDDVGSFDDYAEIISNEFKRLSYNPIVILELGTALIANAVDVIGTVVRVDEYNRVVLDIDKFSLGMIKNKTLDYTYTPIDNKKEPIMASQETYKVYGCTCIEDDVLIDDLSYVPNVGDTITFHNCGAYSYCFEPDFIIPRQEVIIE